MTYLGPLLLRSYRGVQGRHNYRDCVTTSCHIRRNKSLDYMCFFFYTLAFLMSAFYREEGLPGEPAEPG